jgi:hypothetical protein
MDYIVYIADECKKEAREHGYIDALEKLARDVEQKQNVANFDQFPAPFFVKKKFGDKRGRLIAAQENITGYAVIKFLAVLIKADKKYNDFQESNTNANGDKYLRRVNSEELRKFVEEKIAKEPPPKKQSLSSEEESFLYSSNTNYSLENESLIYESEDWIKAINSKPYINYLSPICNVISNIANKDSVDTHSINIENLPNHNIVFFADHEKKYLFLIGLCSTGENSENIFEQWKKKQESTDIARLARRSYPYYLLADPDIWFEIEKDPQSNFALSGEEINVLKSISGQNPFPFFINGRAGSGKSTILQYIFAEYFSRYLSYQDALPPPVYFTYNSELLKQAKIFVTGLLKTNSNFAGNIQDKVCDDDLSQKLDVSFNELRKYLLSIVDNEAVFLQDKYVNYSTFIRLWNEKFRADKTAQKEYPADISWHVIRTYIEGISPEDYLEPEEYVGLEKDQKTVSFELYQKIYKTVWEWYKNLKEEQNLWDDQDLVRYIIENDLATPRFSGVFCDESQDFTRIEMEVIYRLSIFSDRDIPVQHVSKIPFAFAGDELQTINPTGFRWDAITALFTEKFILSVYPDKLRLSSKPNFKELKNNYRSTQNIVNFCNALQLFRADRFNIPNLLPQYPWESSGGPQVARFEPKSADFWQKIKEKPDSVVFVIPCNEGEETEWIRGDSELSANITIHNEMPDILVLSVNSAKGLEFPRVAVWKFGSQNGLDKLINKPVNEDVAQLLPLQYHINKTYVAVSRAKSKLYILDNDSGINNLWRVTTDNGLITSYLSRINKSQKKWEHSNLEVYKEGSASDFSDNVTDNQDETAKQLMENGLNNRHSYLLRQAARIFANLKNNQQSTKCNGYAEIFDKDYFSAGDHFYNGGWTDLAVQAFLLANTINNDKISDRKGFEKIKEIGASNSALANSLYYHVALAVCDTAVNVITDLLDFLLNNTAFNFDKHFPHDAIKDMIGGALNECLKQINDNAKSSESLLQKTVDLYQRKIIFIQPDIIALIAYSLLNFKLAVEYWDMPTSTKNKEDYNKYKIAQMQLKRFPDNISLLFSEKNYSKIVDEYKKYNGKLSDDTLVIVIQALFFEKQNDDGFNEIAAKIYSTTQFERILKECSSHLDAKEKAILSICQRVSIVFNETWNKTLKLIEDAKSKSINPLYVAIALARTKKLPEQPSTTQKPISDFLEKEFIKHFENVPDSLVFDIGTAIEKAGRRIDILKYYELAQKRFVDNANTDNEQICVERWILAKEMQAKHSGNKEEVRRTHEAAEKRKEYGIEGKIEDFITLDGKSSVIKYIIDNERNQTSNSIKPKVIVVKKRPENQSSNKEEADRNVKQKVEFDLEGYRLVYFTETRRLNIASNSDGKIISLLHSTEKNDCVSTHDYVIIDDFTDDIGDCQRIEGTTICFCITDKEIILLFENAKIVMKFL